MSYVSPSYIDFIRDNIFVTISGNGELSNEVLQLAKKIDSAIVKGPELTYEQLVSRRPSFTISKDIKISKDVYFDKNQRVISYDFIIPDEVNVVNAFSKINGRPYGFTKNREIPLPHTGGPVNIKLTAITNELLVGQCEKTIEIPDVNTEAVCNTGDR
jgi:hypothetical protein